MDYEIVNVTVKNNTENTVLLDSRKSTATTYLLDANDNKFEAMLYENSEDELTINSGEEKEIKIKFSNPYIEKMNAKEYVFSDIYMNINNVNYGNNNVGIIVEL